MKWTGTLPILMSDNYAAPDTLEQLVGHQILDTSEILQAIDWQKYQPENNAQ